MGYDKYLYFHWPGHSNWLFKLISYDTDSGLIKEIELPEEPEFSLLNTLIA